MTVTDPGLIDWRERQYLSQFSQPELGFTVYIGGTPSDPDGETMTARLLMANPDGTSHQVNTYTAARQGPGVYLVTPSSADTQTPGYAELDWQYSVGGQPQQYAAYLEIGPASPHYDALPPEMQDFLNDQVWVRFADLFDSAAGGPNLQSYFQAHWSRGRVAQLMGIALQKINASAQPWSSYTLDGNGGPQYPVQFWGGLLASYTYVEGVKQLIRAYTEQPAFQGPAIARQDRRDYADRWRNALKDEQEELKSLLDVFKIRHVLNGSPRVLVSGGTYGRYAPTRVAGSVAARPRMWARKQVGTNRGCAVSQHKEALGWTNARKIRAWRRRCGQLLRSSSRCPRTSAGCASGSTGSPARSTRRRSCASCPGSLARIPVWPSSTSTARTARWAAARRCTCPRTPA